MILNAYLEKLKTISILIIASLLFGCEGVLVPIYWTCTGHHVQVIKDQFNQTIEEYGGIQKLFIEIYGGSVSQINAPATFGVYKVCTDTKDILTFAYPECQSTMAISGEIQRPNDSYTRYGVLNKISGQLVFNEARTINESQIISSGTYLCRYIGYYYSYEEIKPADDN